MPAATNPPDEIDQACAQQVSHAFDVTHDARYQRARLVGVIKSDGQARDVRLHLLAQFRNQPLRGL